MSDKIICAPPSVFALLRTYLSEEEKSFLGGQLTADDFEFNQVVLGRTLTTATTSAKDTFNVEDTHYMLIRKIRGGVHSTALQSDTAFSYGGATVTSAEHVRAIRLQNCKVSLVNKTRNNVALIGRQGAQSASVSLSDISRPYGEAVGTESLKSLAIIRPKDVLEASFTLQSSNANVENATGAEFKLLIDAWFLRRKRG